jgi:hypothetical protein
MFGLFKKKEGGFEKFFEHYSADTPPQSAGEENWSAPVESVANGISHLLKSHGGVSFNKAVYRLHSPNVVAHWNAIAAEAFPNYSQKIYCFGYDWLGRQFAVDLARVENGQALMLLLDIGFGEALQIPANFQEFHNGELVEYPNEALASNFFSRWLQSGGASPKAHECVGYRIPVSLGGKDEIENLEIANLEVYWGLTGQIHQQI